MGYVFGIRGDSLDARYAGGFKEGGTIDDSVSGGIPEVITDATAIGGEAIRIAGFGGVGYCAYKNWSQTGDFSILMRVNFTAAASTISCMYSFGRPSDRGPMPLIETVYWQAGGGFRTLMFSDTALRGINSVYSGDNTIVDNVWYDMVFTWNNSTGEYKVYQDGVLVDTVASTRTFNDVADLAKVVPFYLGHGDGWHQGWFDVNEVVVWDEIIDPTASGLNFNGASRTAFVDVPAFDGLASTATMPPANKVSLGTEYDDGAGTDYVGTLDQPAIADVRKGTQYGIDGSEYTGTLSVPVAVNTSNVVADIKTNLQARALSLLPAYSKHSYAADISKNKFKGNSKQLSVLPSASSEAEGLLGAVTMDHEFTYTLTNAYNSGAKSQLNDNLHIQRIQELQDDVLSIYTDAIKNKSAIDPNVLLISELQISEPESLDEDKTLSITATVQVKYKLNIG